MNTSIASIAPVPQLADSSAEPIAAAAPSVEYVLAGTWPFEPSTWNALTASIYAAMPRESRWELAAPLRLRARSGAGLTPHEHLLYALLKGKSPFKTFSPVRTPAKVAAGRLAWASLLAACDELGPMVSRLLGTNPVAAGLVQLLRVTRMRAAGLTLQALPPQFSTARRDLVDKATADTPQGKTFSVRHHCEKTKAAFDELARQLQEGAHSSLPLPKWALDYRTELAALAGTHKRLMQTYLANHDIGKPFCLAYDSEGRGHFPFHAALSAQLWRELGGAEAVASLIAQDMDLHTLRAEDVEAFAMRPQAGLLLLGGLASLHANADDFGGVDAEGFKIKFKRLSSRGNRICELLYGLRG